MDSTGTFLGQQVGDCTVTATLPGGASANLTVTVQAATAPPVISNITRSYVSTASVTIQWTTNTPTDSRVEYGLDTSYGSTVSDASAVTAHALTVDGLQPGRIYHFRVHSKDASGKEAVSPDLHFATARR
jgi:hypothetical protein